MYWANIKIVDRIRDRRRMIEYRMEKCKKFSDLFIEIKDIYPGYEEGNNITLLLLTDGNRRVIREFDKYIRDGDVIELTISDIAYLLCDCNGDELKASANIKDLYQLYYTLADILFHEVFIVKMENKEMYLIDVLDSSKRYYNECVNRLIQKYNF